MVTILGSGSEVRSRPGSIDFSESKNADYDFLRKGSKAVGPVRAKFKNRCCRASNCPFHMSSINRTCAAHRAACFTNGIQTMYLIPHCGAFYIGGAELHTHDPISAAVL